MMSGIARRGGTGCIWLGCSIAGSSKRGRVRQCGEWFEILRERNSGDRRGNISVDRAAVN